MYALELRDRSRKNRWFRFAICGKYAALEKVRRGQKCPEEWRVVQCPIPTSFPNAKTA